MENFFSNVFLTQGSPGIQKCVKIILSTYSRVLSKCAPFAKFFFKQSSGEGTEKSERRKTGEKKERGFQLRLEKSLAPPVQVTLICITISLIGENPPCTLKE